MDRITVYNLPRQKLSHVILKVIDDIDRVQKFGYQIDMDEWIAKHDNTCAVCLGGAAIMGFVPDDRVNKGYLGLGSLIAIGVNEGIDESEKLILRRLAYMFNSFRAGNISGAIECWNDITMEHIEDYTISKLVRKDVDEFLDEYNDTNFKGVMTGRILDELKRYLTILSQSFERLGY